MQYWGLCIALLTGFFGYGQEDSLPVNRDFLFTDGLYAELTDLPQNQPTRALLGIDGQMVLQQEDYSLKVERLHPKGRPELAIDLNSVAAIVIKGIPYLRVQVDTVHGFTEYAGLRVRGRLSYFTYEHNGQDSVLIKAYNPATGRAFRQQKVVRPKKETRELVLNLATAEILDFTPENMERLMANDEQLLQTLRSLDEEEVASRLYRLLLIYDDRHPLLLPARKQM